MQFQTKESTKKVHVNIASLEEKEDFRKRTIEQILVDKQLQQQQ
jgi:hypothetical protein